MEEKNKRDSCRCRGNRVKTSLVQMSRNVVSSLFVHEWVSSKPHSHTILDLQRQAMPAVKSMQWVNDRRAFSLTPRGAEASETLNPPRRSEDWVSCSPQKCSRSGGVLTLLHLVHWRMCCIKLDPVTANEQASFGTTVGRRSWQQRDM